MALPLAAALPLRRRHRHRWPASGGARAHPRRGRPGRLGVAAETLAAKWFDKDPRWTDAQNEHQLRRALEIAEAAFLTAGANTAFGHFADGYAAHTAACGREELNPLVASYGRRFWTAPRSTRC